MPLLSWQDLSGQTLSVKLDATSDEGHEDTADLSDHPVEEGVVITDHIRNNPTAFYLTGFVSSVPMPGKTGVASGSAPLKVDYMPPRGTQQIPLDIPSPPVPLNPAGAIRAGVGALAKAISGKPKATVWGKAKKAKANLRATVLQFGTVTNRPKEIYDLLLDAYHTKAFITVQTSLREHTDMQITRLAPAKSVGNGEAIEFQIDLRKVRIASSETVQAPTPIEARGAKKLNAGSQSTTGKTGTPDQAVKLESTLSKILF